VQRSIGEIYASASQARRQGELQRWQELMGRSEMAARPFAQQAQKHITQIGQRMRAVLADRTLSAGQKNRQLRELRARRDAIARAFDERARAG